MGSYSGTSSEQGVHGMVQRLDYSVVCGIEITNSTMYNLENPHTTMEWGYLFSPPKTIKTKETGILVRFMHNFLQHFNKLVHVIVVLFKFLFQNHPLKGCLSMGSLTMCH